MQRGIYLVAGWAALGLGVIGIVLPLLPTTPFVLLAAFLFTRGSPRARAWLVEHARFGPVIAAWEENGAIPRRAKIASAVAMAAVFALSLALGLASWLLAVQGVCLVGAALFVWTRPDG